MRDINFFELYVEKREFKVDGRLIVFAIISFAILSLAAYGIFNGLLIRDLKAEVDSYRTIVEDPRTQKKVQEIKEKEGEVRTFRTEVEKIRELDRLIESTDIIDDDILKFISLKMPDELFLTSFSIYNRDMQLAGVSKDKLAIAEFEKGLETMEELNSIFISNITKDDEDYRFNLNITLKDVVLNGDETSEEEKSQD